MNQESPWLSNFRIDLRMLAAGRILLGLIIFFDFLQALAWRDLYYTDFGVLPRTELAGLGCLDYSWSPYLLVGSPAFTELLLVLSAACALAFALGWKGKWTTPLIWLAVLSLQERNPFVLIGGDAWLRATLFWMIFLPCTEYYSLDRVKSGPCRRPTRVANAATVGLLLQVVYIYLWAGMAKSGESYQSGTALYYVLSGLEFGESRAQWLLHYPELLSWLSKSIPYWELVAGALLILPCPVGILQRLGYRPYWPENFFRNAGVLALIGLHLGIWYCMELYIFSAVAVATLLTLFLPGRSTENVTPPYLPRPVSVVLLAWCFLVLAYNPVANSFPDKVSRKTRVRANLLGLEQLWRLFAPTTPVSSYIIYPVAVLNDGSLQYLSFEGEKRDAPPDHGDPDYHVRLVRYWRSLIESGNQGVSTRRLQSYARYFARRWSRLYPEHKTEISRIRLYYQVYPVLPGYEDAPPERPLLVADIPAL